MRHYTVIYKDVQAGEEAQELGSHPKVVALSWSHVMDERDRLKESHAALVRALEKIRDMHAFEGHRFDFIEEALALAKGD